jgi:hypothetical protein
MVCDAKDCRCPVCRGSGYKWKVYPICQDCDIILNNDEPFNSYHNCDCGAKPIWTAYCDTCNGSKEFRYQSTTPCDYDCKNLTRGCMKESPIPPHLLVKISPKESVGSQFQKNINAENLSIYLESTWRGYRSRRLFKEA